MARLTEAEKQARVTALHGLVSSGMTLKEAGAVMGFSRQRAHQLLKKHGYPTSSKRPGMVCRVCFVRFRRKDRYDHVRTPEHQAMVAPRRFYYAENIERNDAIVRDYLNGLKPGEIAARNGVPHATSIYPILRRRGINTRSKMTTMLQTRQKVADAMAAGAVTAKEIAAASGVSTWAARHHQAYLNAVQSHPNDETEA